MVPHPTPTSTLPEPDLLRAARFVLRTAESDDLNLADHAIAALRAAVLTLDLAAVTRERDEALCRAEWAEAAVARQRADIEHLHEQLRLARRAQETRQHVDGLLNGYASEREASHG